MKIYDLRHFQGFGDFDSMSLLLHKPSFSTARQRYAISVNVFSLFPLYIKACTALSRSYEDSMYL